MKATRHKNSWKKQDLKMAEEGDKIEIIVGPWKGRLGTVMEIKEWVTVFTIKHCGDTKVGGDGRMKKQR
jgi:ribosomal protein L24